MLLIRTLYTVFICFSVITCYSQKNMKIVYHGIGYQHIKKHLKSDFEDSLSLKAYLEGFTELAYKKGYLMTSVDSVKTDTIDSITNVYFYIGEIFNTVNLKIESDIESQFIKKHAHINDKITTQLPFRPREIVNLMNSIQAAYEQNGFPFSKVKLSTIDLLNNSLSATIEIDRGPSIVWSPIQIKGDSSISAQYISNLLGIKPGDPFDQNLLIAITPKIAQIPFIEELKPSEILFTKEGAELFLYLKSVPTSAINGVIGFQPSSDGSEMTVTGDLNLKLLNVLNRGELLDLRWQSIRDQTQSLNSVFNYPFLFKSPFGIDMKFDLYKRDSTFLEINFTVGIQYFLSQGKYIKGYYEKLGSTILSGGLNNPNYSNLGDITNNMYGLAFSSMQIDYLPNPSRGLIIYMESSAGNRVHRLKDNSQTTKSLSFKGEVKLDGYIPLYKRNVLHLANYTEFYSVDGVFQNELIRFGGLNSQRGFNEDELTASTKSTTTVEYRFLLDKNSHVFAFGDITWYENNSLNYIQDTPFGFGVGFSFSTNFGVFSISYALGKQFNNPILFSDGKIHFGYIAYF